MKEALKDMDRTYGVEIEFTCSDLRNGVAAALTAAGIPCQNEGYNHTTRRNWKIVYDASVGYGDDAMELVSPPLKGMDGLEQIEKVCAVLKSLNARITKNCGLHVHHDAKRFKAENLRRIVQLYAAFESELDKMMPESRRVQNNRYTKSLKHGFDNLQFDTNYAGRIADAQNVNYRSESRYYKININAFHQHGTIEFRHHGGTVDAQKIIAWVILTQRMVERCKGTRPAPVKEVKQWRDVLSACGIPNIALEKLPEGEAKLVQYTIDRREFFRKEASRRNARQNARRARACA